MKRSVRLSFFQVFAVIFKSFSLMLFLISIPVNLPAQPNHLSKKESRKIQIDSIFEKAESKGYDTKGILRYEYYFTSEEKGQLDALSAKMVKDSYEIKSPLQMEGKKWRLALRKNEIQSRESMVDVEKRMGSLAYKFLVDAYDGFLIYPCDINALNVPNGIFGSFIKALDNEPLFRTATNLLEKKAYDKAMVAFQECIERHYKEDTSHFEIGNALVATNKFVKGIEQWELARTLNPKYLEPFMKLGSIFYENANFNRSLFNFKKADALDPYNDQILYHIAETLYQLERYNESYQYASRAVKLNRKNLFAKSMLENLEEPSVKKLRKQSPDK